MALIQCPECNNTVSSIAASCPRCGAPVSGIREAVASGTPLVTTQLTSKRLKLFTLVGASAFFLGVIWLAFEFLRGADEFFPRVLYPGALMLFGILWTAAIRIRIWWHHG